MRKTTWILLPLLAAALSVGCNGKEDDPDAKKSPDQAKTPKKADEPLAPSTKPKEYLEASRIYEKLTATQPGSASTQPATMPADAPGESPMGDTGAQGDVRPPAAPDAEVPQPPEPPKPPEPATKPATPPPAQKPAEPEQFAPLQTPADKGYVDWSRGMVVATGIGKANKAGASGKLMALRAAEIVAKRNALEVAAGIKMRGNREVRIAGTVRDARAVRRDYDAATQTATVTIEVPLYGLQGVVRTDTQKVQLKGSRWEWVVKDPLPEESDLIIIDVRGKAFRPVLAPKLVTEAGQMVYDPADKGDKLGEQHAFVYARYTGTGKLVRHGEFRRVIFLRPASITDDSIILSAEDLKTLTRHADARELLRAGLAVIVVSSRDSGDSN